MYAGMCVHVDGVFLLRVSFLPVPYLGQHAGRAAPYMSSSGVCVSVMNQHFKKDGTLTMSVSRMFT